MTHTLPNWRGVWLCCCLLLQIGWLQAQDPSFSQFFANRIYLNPAFTGIEGGIAAGAVARMQWASVDRGFRTYDLTVEGQLPVARLGLGLHLNHNQEALADLTTQTAGLALSYTIPGRRNNFHFGLEGMYVQKSINWDALTFTDELDPVYGVINPTAAAPVLDRIAYGDLNFGMLWRHEGGNRLSGRGLSRTRSHVGLSFHHLPYLFSQSVRGNDSFLNSDSRIAPRITLHGGMMIPMTVLRGVGNYFALSPNVKLDVQGYDIFSGQGNLMVGTAGMFALIQHFYVGLFYQNRFYAPNAIHTDAFILTVGGYLSTQASQGVDQPDLWFGISADLNSTGLGPGAGSVFELTLRYRLQPQGKLGGRPGSRSGSRSTKKILDCKHFF
jgi:type IX secretion system PorP/SprF family membrane protein